jgi:hypothetical protein
LGGALAAWAGTLASSDFGSDGAEEAAGVSPTVLSPAALSAVAAGGVAVKSRPFCSWPGAGVLALSAFEFGSGDCVATGAALSSVGAVADGGGAAEAAGAIAIGGGEGAMGFVVGVTAREVFEVPPPF